jgi:hypothetical protein
MIKAAYVPGLPDRGAYAAFIILKKGSGTVTWGRESAFLSLPDCCVGAQIQAVCFSFWPSDCLLYLTLLGVLSPEAEELFDWPKDGRYYAKENSLINSTYTVVWQPVRFIDMEGHWADKTLLDRAPRLKIVCNISVCYDNLDLPELRKRGVLATNTPDVLNETVADTRCSKERSMQPAWMFLPRSRSGPIIRSFAKNLILGTPGANTSDYNIKMVSIPMAAANIMIVRGIRLEGQFNLLHSIAFGSHRCPMEKRMILLGRSSIPIVTRISPLKWRAYVAHISVRGVEPPLG